MASGRTHIIPNHASLFSSHFSVVILFGCALGGHVMFPLIGPAINILLNNGDDDDDDEDIVVSDNHDDYYVFLKPVINCVQKLLNN